MTVSNLLLEWYRINERELPWRETSDPYKIWISEIILQQTRVSQGIDYYLRFIESFPTVKNLASASETKVLKVWEGLGYYSRARNIHTSAKIIMNKHEGKFPEMYSDIIKLKGIGPYTAGAISSIAFNQPYPAIDGNVKRVISRLYGIIDEISGSAGLKKVESIIYEIIDKTNPGRFNQALMDFGSLICSPKNPQCFNCILKDICHAYNNNMVNEIPVVYKKAKTRNRTFLYFIYTQDGNTIINTRLKNDIWKGLYEFPLIEFKSMPKDLEWIYELKKSFQLNEHEIQISKVSPTIKHILSHQKIEAVFVHIEIPNLNIMAQKNKFTLIPLDKLVTFPFPRLIQKYIVEHIVNK